MSYWYYSRQDVIARKKAKMEEDRERESRVIVSNTIICKNSIIISCSYNYGFNLSIMYIFSNEYNWFRKKRFDLQPVSLISLQFMYIKQVKYT